MGACRDAGVDEDGARTFVEDESAGLQDVRMVVREQTGNGVDGMPYTVFEERRRDFMLVGAKAVGSI
ncbi:hypothetical protein K469DRAFT_713824 [Zopfia rhizophila CBS 207.26]|uniref:Uncharacterized protein n=1 Tax=Zopfia rhizophila CBS 207.26 TaxID=1314779 RepID=A0A6A6DPH8_9PEZI|nr:hypothetical protein K469DRAFT_713824 [Zopfia rhizophila CBS 207.26]